MAQVATRTAQQPNGAAHHHYSPQKHRGPAGKHDSPSSPRSFPGDRKKLGRATSFSSSSISPSSLPTVSATKHGKSKSMSHDGGAASAGSGDLPSTMKQRGMLHALLSEPVRFVKSNEKQGQDYSSMGIVPINEQRSNGASNTSGESEAKADGSSKGSLLLHTSSLKLNGDSSSKAFVGEGQAGPSSVALSSPVKAKKQARDFYPYKISLRFPGKVRAAATGLTNYGNTCYMNSVMQALIHTPPLAYALLTQELDALYGEWGGKPNVAFDAVRALQSFARRSLQGSHSVNAPQDFNRNLKTFAKPLRQGRQEDAHEYMRFLLEAIQQSCLSRAPKAFKADDPARQTTFVQKIFGGRLRSRVTCHNCNHNSDTFDPIMDLSLDMRKGISSLNDAFRAFVAKDKLTGSEKYRCDSCKRRVDATKQFTIDKAPAALTIHLKRFTIFGGKISRQIAFDDSLNIAPYMSDRSGSARYRLYAVVHHYGSGPNSGHYVASVKSPSGRWTHMDDSHVSEMKRQGPIGDSSAYILFYLREKDEALEQAISGSAASTKGKDRSSSGFPPASPARNGAIEKKRKLQPRSESDAETDGSEDSSDAAVAAPRLPKLSEKQRQEVLRARARSAESSLSQKKLRKQLSQVTGDSDGEREMSSAGPSRTMSSQPQSSKSLDEALSSRPKSAASFYGSSSSANGYGRKSLASISGIDDGETGDELGTAVARNDYESLVGGGTSSGKAKMNGKATVLPDGPDEESEDESDADGPASASIGGRVPLSKKEKRRQKKAAAQVAAASRKGATASPYSFGQRGHDHGANNSHGNPKKPKKSDLMRRRYMP